MSLKVGYKIDPQKHLIFFDEIQDCPQALSSLKYFAQDIRQLPIISAGSHLGLVATEGANFRRYESEVGQVSNSEQRSKTHKQQILYLELTLTKQKIKKKQKIAFNKVWITFKFCMVLFANNFSVIFFCFAVDKQCSINN